MVSSRVELCCVVWWIVWCDELIISNRILVESMNGVWCGVCCAVVVYVCLSVSYRGNFAFVNKTIDLSVCQSVSISLYLPVCACVRVCMRLSVSWSACQCAGLKWNRMWCGLSQAGCLIHRVTLWGEVEVRGEGSATWIC